MASFNIAYQKVLAGEGGYANHPSDRGGETYKGIARNFHPSWTGWSIVDAMKPLRTNQVIKDAYLDSLVAGFYKKNYWDKLWLDNMPNQDFANFFFDFYVNAGGTAVKILQRILGTVPDGKYGAKTNNALLSSNLSEVYQKYFEEREEFYRNNKQFAIFGRGWINRLYSFPSQIYNQAKDNPGITILLLISAIAGLFFLIKYKKK